VWSVCVVRLELSPDNMQRKFSSRPVNRPEFKYKKAAGQFFKRGQGQGFLCK
jgi:hypothetical protein